MQKIVANDFEYLEGEIEIPPDKSLSHRAVIFSALADGKSVIRNFSDGKDPCSTLNLFKNLGVDIEIKTGNTVIVNSNGILHAPQGTLDCGNSGTTMRLTAGILAGQNFSSVLTGDESLSKRPMKRIIEPLGLMGADISSNDEKAPLHISGKPLHGIDYVSKNASAQVKSCILLAGLQACGKTTVTEPYISRNHSEIMLKHMGADLSINGNSISIQKSKLNPLEITICGDISSAAYFIAAGLIVPKSRLILKNTGLNPTRTGIIDVVREMGGYITILDKRETCGEITGDIEVKYSNQLKGCNIGGGLIPKLIDEIPVIAVLATQAQGQTIITDAQDLRNKESDRIKTVVTELTKLGADITETPDGMIINGKTKLSGGVETNTYNDHRLAMSLYVTGLITEKEISINGFEWAEISFPAFEQLFEKVKR